MTSVPRPSPPPPDSALATSETPVSLDPVVREIPYSDPASLLPSLAQLPGLAFLDSAPPASTRPDPAVGRFSYIAADPVATLTGGFGPLSDYLSRWTMTPDPSLPPFQGGMIGVLGYDLGQTLEDVPAHRGASLGFPDSSCMYYDVVASFDHVARRAWIVSTGVPEPDPVRRTARARERLHWLESLLSTPAVPAGERPPGTLTEAESGAAYRERVARIVEYIHAGDICQANLSLRFEADRPAGFDPVSCYLHLRDAQPAPFSACIDTGHGWVLSLSMERFLSLRGREVETRPIKGTRPRGGGATPEEDARLQNELATSCKDRAENVMIVDLLRNDLSKVCEPHSVRVPSLCAIESHTAVHHLVSTVQGTLAPGVTAIDLLRATFPGGSITGAPKIRAMEIIAELETAPRGPYCGSAGYIGWDGSMDTSILIRTLLVSEKKLSLSAGAGIVADSVPEQEYEECHAKVGGILAALAR